MSTTTKHPSEMTWEESAALVEYADDIQERVEDAHREDLRPSNVIDLRDRR